MRRGFGIALVLAGCLLAAPGLLAQAQNGNGSAGSGDAGQKKTNGANQQNGQQGAQPKPQPAGNPFPEDTNSVPVMPSKVTPDEPPGNFSETEGIPAPRNDEDPVGALTGLVTRAGNVQDQESSSDTKNLDSLLPKPGDDDTDSRGKSGATHLTRRPRRHRSRTSA